jgi:hypothetical protein
MLARLAAARLTCAPLSGFNDSKAPAKAGAPEEDTGVREDLKSLKTKITSELNNNNNCSGHYSILSASNGGLVEKYLSPCVFFRCAFPRTEGSGALARATRNTKRTQA